jgi:serine/threonine protein kinase
VVQAIDKETGESFALKIIPFKSIREPKQFQHIINEKLMLSKLNNKTKFFPAIYDTFFDSFNFHRADQSLRNMFKSAANSHFLIF